MSDENGTVKSTAAGAAVNGADAIGAVAVSGPVAGLGAAGITPGLAAVSNVVGGGMAAGLAITAAAPLAAGAIAYGNIVD